MAFLLLWGALLSCSLIGGEDPTGREIYESYRDAIDELESFQFDSRYLWTAGGDLIGDCTIRYFLKKPNTYRVEIIDPQGDLAGLLVCDGAYSWRTWPKGTTLFTQHTGSYTNELEVYTKDRAFLGGSVSHQLLFPHVSMPVFNANVFFGGSESVMEYLDDVEYLGEETIEGEPCYKIKVSMMKGQRVRTYWISKKDRLPRKLFGELVVANPQTTEEVWVKMKLNPALDDDLFAWSPPDGWEERRLPSLEERLLQVGEEAADFTLDDAEGKSLALSEYHGKIIWLMFWRIG